MSGVEVVGVVASTLQIAACISNFIVLVIDVREELRRGPSKIKEQAEYLTSLLFVLQSLEKNPLLQHPDIQIPLELLEDKVRLLQDKLHRYLGPPTRGPVRKVFVAIGGVQVEQKIASTLQALDRETSSLQLYILAKSSEEVHWLSETYMMDSKRINKLLKPGKVKDKEGKFLARAPTETQLVKKDHFASEGNERETKDTQKALTARPKYEIEHIENLEPHLSRKPRQLEETPSPEYQQDQIRRSQSQEMPGHNYHGKITYSEGSKARYGDTTNVSPAWAGFELPPVSKRRHNFNIQSTNAPKESDYGDETNYGS